MVDETKKILDQSIEVSATCVRVPVFIGHSEAVNIEFDSNINLDEVEEALRDSPGISLVDDVRSQGAACRCGDGAHSEGAGRSLGDSDSSSTHCISLVPCDSPMKSSYGSR